MNKIGPLSRIQKAVEAQKYADYIAAYAVWLNTILYSSVRSIPEAEMERFTEEYRGHCERRGNSPQYTQAWLPHRYRLYLTIKWMEDLINQFQYPLLAIDLGGESPATDLFKQYFPDIKWGNSNSDLRYRWNFDDQTFDLIVCTELLEHVSEPPEGFDDSFFKTGLKAVLKESYRVLKPGGAMFITTPNAASILHLNAALHGAPPWFFPHHVREYTIGELKEELEAVGFEVEKYETFHCLTIDYNQDYSPLYEILLKYHYVTADRGDDIFLTARKKHSTEAQSA